jgi:stearoyl-CoA desaturase (delta-9 desaturase)
VLAPSELAVDALGAAAVQARIADQGDELPQRLLHPGPDSGAEAAAQGPPVRRHLVANRGDHLVGERRDLRAQEVADPRRKLSPGLGGGENLLSHNKSLPSRLGHTRRMDLECRLGSQIMSRTQRYSNIGAVVVPFIAFIAAIVLLWNRAVGWTDLAILAGMYLVTAMGITIGFHRMLTHRAFQSHKATEYGFAIAGTMAVQGPVIDWVADHRKHHAHTDEEGDPHSPHVGHGSGLAGLWHAHVGWLFDSNGQADRRKYAPDLMEDVGMRAIQRRFLWIVVASLGIPFALGFLITGSLAGGLTGMLWGGLVRIFFVHHVTWSINSICHYHGARRFETDDQSTNVWWLAPFSLGEAWHHNHHAFPRSAFSGLRWWELDLSGLVIRAMKRLGLAWNVVQIAPERQQQKLA